MSRDVDTLDAWLRLKKAKKRQVRRNPNVDKNRRWKILQYMYERGAVDPDTAVTTREIADAVGISIVNCSVTLRNMRSNWVCKVGWRKGRWYLSSNALNFAKIWGGFLNHPWIKPPLNRGMGA